MLQCAFYFVDLFCCQLVETKYFHHYVLESGPCFQLYSSEESQFCHWEDLEQVVSIGRPLSMAGCLWMSLPLSSGPFQGSSVLTSLEPSPKLSYTHAQRDPPSAWDPSTVNLCEAQTWRKRKSQCEHIQGPIVEPYPHYLFHWCWLRGGEGRGQEQVWKMAEN